jgi:hypothetical protein
MELVGLLTETTTAPSREKKSIERLDGYARKFAELVLQERTRFWFGRQWEELAHGEYAPEVVTRLQHVVDSTWSPALRNSWYEAEAWPAIIRRMHCEEPFRLHEARKADFIMDLEAVSRAIDQPTRRLHNEIYSDADRCREWIRRPAFAQILRAVERSTFADPRWAERLARFPDTLAHARWARLVAWYAFRRSLTGERARKKAGNDYEDAAYAFLASYT